MSHAEFRAGLPAGRFRVVINPQLARSYVSGRLLLWPVVTALVGVGLAVAFTGAPWFGGALVVGAIVLNRGLKANAGRILLHLATQDAAVYDFATQNGLLEVQRA